MSPSEGAAVVWARARLCPLARTEVAVSRWLTGEGFPAAQAVEDLEQPLLIDGHPVTFWHLIVEGDRKATYGELGGVLRELHSLSVPDGLDLPSFEPFDKQELRLDRAVIPEDDQLFLRKRWRELRDKYAELRFETPKGPVHGDAHVQNLMVDDQGQVILIDFEAFCFDHPEWDLMVTAVEHYSLGWQTDEQYADFVAAYGRDLYDWEGYETLRGLQEFGMTTWLMQNVREDEQTAEEYRRRIAGLRNDDGPRDWRALVNVPGDAAAFPQVMARLRVPRALGRPRTTPDVVLADKRLTRPARSAPICAVAGSVR